MAARENSAGRLSPSGGKAAYGVLPPQAAGEWAAGPSACGGLPRHRHAALRRQAAVSAGDITLTPGVNVICRRRTAKHSFAAIFIGPLYAAQ